MTTHTGSCLCGDIRYEIRGTIPGLYQCHCSLCRKVTGSVAYTAFMVPAKDFSWRTKDRKIRHFQRPTGFRNDFCERCGSPVPFAMEAEGLAYIPAGSVDGALLGTRVTNHIFVASKADWDEIGGNAPRHDGDPGMETILGRPVERRES
jgi:hypothetical protein